MLEIDPSRRLPIAAPWFTALDTMRFISDTLLCLFPLILCISGAPVQDHTHLTITTRTATVTTNYYKTNTMGIETLNAAADALRASVKAGIVQEEINAVQEEINVAQEEEIKAGEGLPRRSPYHPDSLIERYTHELYTCTHDTHINTDTYIYSHTDTHTHKQIHPTLYIDTMTTSRPCTIAWMLGSPCQAMAPAWAHARSTLCQGWRASTCGNPTMTSRRYGRISGTGLCHNLNMGHERRVPIPHAALSIHGLSLDGWF